MKLNKGSYSSTKKIFINGVIYSIDKKNNVYEAMVIEDGIIIALGCNEEVSNYYTDETEIVDLKSKIIIPGFINAHCQIPERMIIKRDELSLFDVSNMKSYLKLIQCYIDSHPEEKIIYGVGWRNSVFEDNEGEFHSYVEVIKGPNKKYLEKIKTDKPIVLKSFNGHTLWLNDTAFKYFKITKDTKVPVGGKIELDEEGELWGTLKENATCLVDMENIKCKNKYQEDDYLNTFIKYQNTLHSYGVTTIGLIHTEGLKIPLDIYKKLEAVKKLKLRIVHGVIIKPKKICKKTVYEQMHELKRNRILYGTKLFDIKIAKFFADGIIENMTAYLFKTYESVNKNGSSDNGMFLWEESEFKEAIKMANRLEFNVFIHAVGDLACKQAIDGLQDSFENNINKGYRNSLININLITKYYIKRMKSLNINSIIYPFWFYKDIISDKNEVLTIGEERAQRQYPVKSLIYGGVITAGGSDIDILEKSDPLKAIECSTLRNLYDFIPSGYPEKVDMEDIRYRLNPNERISVIDSVKMFTINAAYILGKEREIGSLEIGKKADFIVLDQDIFNIKLLDIKNINIERTYFDGKLVYLNE